MRRVLSILPIYIPGHPAAFFEPRPSSIIAKYIFRTIKKKHGNYLESRRVLDVNDPWICRGNQHFDHNYY